MYFSGLRKLLGSVEEKLFYDVALMYLSAQRYRDLSIVDGTGDGGRDVICSRPDLRIQLSVRKDWENKINEEAANTIAAGATHLIYVTNRVISPKKEAAFRASVFKHAGVVDVSIHDVNRITTALARPGRIARAYEMLGASVAPTVQATTSEIAVSSLLLFGHEAAELREEIVDANVRAWLLHNPNANEQILVDEVARALPGANPVKGVMTAVSRLRTTGHIVGPKSGVSLSAEEAARMKGAEDEFLLAREADVQKLVSNVGITYLDASQLLSLALETLLRGDELTNGDAQSESVREFLAQKGLSRRRTHIYKLLSECSITKHFQYAKTVDRIFATSTFDIYRALGGKTDITMVLDTSVALPMLFGLEFQVATSRYAVGATTLLDVCQSHEIGIMVPRSYINEMAAHGLQAVDYLQTYDELPADVKPFLRGSGNAYLSHYSHISTSMEAAGRSISLADFLETFGLRPGTTIRRVENRILTLLEQHNFRTGMTAFYDGDIRAEIAKAKPSWTPKHILDHDAAVCTSLLNDSERGYILATWDRVMIDTVQGLARVYADSPARVTDFLSSIEGIDYEYDRSSELLTTLLHIDERYVERVAAQIERAKTPNQLASLRRYIEDAKAGNGESWLPDVDDLTHFLDSSSPDEVSSNIEG